MNAHAPICPVCGEQATGSRTFYRPQGDCNYDCPACGLYRLTYEAQMDEVVSSLTKRQKGNLSAWLYRNPEQVIKSFDFDKVRNIKAPSISDRLILLLLHIARNVETLDKNVAFEIDWAPVSWSAGKNETFRLLDLLAELELLIKNGPKYTISAKGWQRVEQLEHEPIESNQCFVAMRFSDDMESVYESTIAPAVRDAGYDPLKVNDAEYTEKIDDRIIAEIRRSKFLIADFTEHAHGVYYEAGFGKGMGKEVVWTCNEEDLENLHFDIRQYNCIVWSSDKLDEFRKRLALRIESILGRGTSSARS